MLNVPPTPHTLTIIALAFHPMYSHHHLSLCLLFAMHTMNFNVHLNIIHPGLLHPPHCHHLLVICIIDSSSTTVKPHLTHQGLLGPLSTSKTTISPEIGMHYSFFQGLWAVHFSFFILHFHSISSIIPYFHHVQPHLPPSFFPPLIT